MKLICLKDSLPASYGKHNLSLTIDKVYETIPFIALYVTQSNNIKYIQYCEERDREMWQVINDDGTVMAYGKKDKIFLSIAEWREKQIEEILN